MTPIFVSSPSVVQELVAALGFFVLLAAGPVIVAVVLLRVAWTALWGDEDAGA